MNEMGGGTGDYAGCNHGSAYRDIVRLPDIGSVLTRDSITRRIIVFPAKKTATKNSSDFCRLLITSPIF